MRPSRPKICFAQFIRVCSYVKTSARGEKLRIRFSAEVRATGDAHRCRCSRTFTNSATSTRVTPTAIHADGQSGRSSVPGVPASRLAPGGHSTSGLGASATGVLAAGVPCMTAPRRGVPRASGRWGTGFSPPAGWAGRVHLGAAPEHWAAIAAPAITGVGGGARRRSPTSWIATSRARSKPTHSILPPAGRAKHPTAGRPRWVADPGSGARSVNRVGATLTKTGQR